MINLLQCFCIKIDIFWRERRLKVREVKKRQKPTRRVFLFILCFPFSFSLFLPYLKSQSLLQIQPISSSSFPHNQIKSPTIDFSSSVPNSQLLVCLKWKAVPLVDQLRLCQTMKISSFLVRILLLL